MLRRSDSTIFKICLMFTDRDPENVKDMYQDIVCSLWESWPRFRGQCKENTWVYSIAFNTAVSQVRHRAIMPMFLPLDDDTYNNLAEESHNGLIERLYELIDRLSLPRPCPGARDGPGTRHYGSRRQPPYRTHKRQTQNP